MNEWKIQNHLCLYQDLLIFLEIFLFKSAQMLFYMITSFLIVHIQSVSGQEISDSLTLSVCSRPASFDVAALFVHQRQQSALSHSANCLLLIPSLWPGSGHCFSSTPGAASHSHLVSCSHQLQSNQQHRCVTSHKFNTYFEESGRFVINATGS